MGFTSVKFALQKLKIEAMAAAADKKKRLPKALQDYKREIKELPFKDRVKAYFDCAPFTSDLDGQKKEIIFKSFSKEEREEYYRKFYPIYSSIDRYGDRIRAINGNRMIYANYIDSALRQRDCFNYTADILNLALPKIAEALEGTKEESTRKTLEEALKRLRGYRKVTITAPDIKLNKEGTRYIVLGEEEDKFLLGAIATLRGILSLLKCYLESLKEFLEWVGTPELLPKEFYNMETDLLNRFRPFPTEGHKNPDADLFPLFCGESEVAKEYLSIDYKELPRSIDIFGDNNLFGNAYRRFFNY